MGPSKRKRLIFSLLLSLWGAVLVSAAGAAAPSRPQSPELPADTLYALPDSLDLSRLLERDSTLSPLSGNPAFLPADSAAGPLPDSLFFADDSIRMLPDSLPPDSLAVLPPLRPGIDATVHGKQTGFMDYNARTRELSMHENAEVTYTDLEIRAEFVELSFETNNVRAMGAYDTIQEKYKRPIFIESDTEYELDSVIYNIDTRKAIIRGVRTVEGEGILTGDLVKKMADNVIHMKGGRYTTCDADCPHFYIQMSKGVVVPGKKVVFGPAYMVIEDVPFYVLGLPFGFFPQQGSRKSGFIMPSVGEEVVKGFFIREGGYYHVFNDYVDARLTAGIYTLGSWEANLGSNYRKRYTFAGNFGFDFAKDIFGEKGSADYVDQQNIRIRWTHQQDPKFRPSSTFSASVNYATSKYNQYNATNMNDYLSSQISSSIAYSKNWVGKPYSLSMNASHSQNLQDSSMSLSFPNVVFNVSRINPFKRKIAIGRERWYEKIAFTYTGNFQNNAQFKQDEFFTKDMLDKMKFGFQHQIPVSASFNLFQYLNITPSVSYTERWYFRKIHRDWNPETERVENTDTTHGFYRLYNYTTSVSMNTRIYGNYTLGKKKPVFFRHVMNPTVGFSYTPNFGAANYGYYETIQSDKYGGTTTYSPFANEIYGVPGNGQSMAMNFSLGNTLEAKVPSIKDTTGYRKLKLIEALNISSSYNFLADSLNLSPFTVNLRTTVVKGFNLNINANFDPYIVQDGRRVHKYVATHGKGLARLTSTSFSFGYGLSSKVRNSNIAASNNPDNNAWAAADAMLNDPTQTGFFETTQNQYAVALQRAQMLASQYYDFNVPWSFNFNYNFSFNRPLDRITRVQTVSFNGSLSLTEKWAVEFGAGYDFVQSKLTPGTVMIRRDLHCFQATLSWVPVGFRQSWTFTIRAKSSMLADLLKYKKTNSFLDNYYLY